MVSKLMNLSLLSLLSAGFALSAFAQAPTDEYRLSAKERKEIKHALKEVRNSELDMNLEEIKSDLNERVAALGEALKEPSEDVAVLSVEQALLKKILSDHFYPGNTPTAEGILDSEKFDMARMNTYVYIYSFTKDDGGMAIEDAKCLPRSRRNCGMMRSALKSDLKWSVIFFPILTAIDSVMLPYDIVHTIKDAKSSSEFKIND